ncbi:MAG: DinB family protein [Ginsengibacter sp.]
MSKKYFIELSEFNIWANDRVCNWLDKISDEQWEQPLVSSFNSIYETILHVAGAEKVWVERLQKKSNPEMLLATFIGSKAELLETWKDLSLDFKKLIEEMSEDQFQQKLLYKNTKGIEYNQSYYQLLTHVFNHSTYHRGQVVTMLRQVGFTDVNSTDMTTYFRIKNEFPTQVFSN